VSGAARLRRALVGTPLAEAAGAVAARVAETPELDAVLARAPDAVCLGVARAAAASPDGARLALRRRGLPGRLAELDGAFAARRADELARDAGAEPDDLEAFLDELRLLRRDETFLAACADFGGLAPFEDVSRLLSAVAEAVVRRALRAASRSVAGAETELAVVAMGKLGGREFTYHSDLDLIFLYGGGVEAVAGASRIAQRLISYVTTMTTAGVAYAVDSRLRPSGNQGMLVTSFDGFESYQSQEAATWESLALVRARAIAGARATADATLARVHARVFGGVPARWPEIADMRRRVEAERAPDETRGVELKLGPGGLMDVEFLAEGAVLELGRRAERAPLPSVPDLLRATAGAEAVSELLEDYAFLRRVESRMRWCAGRAEERLATDARLPAVAELIEPGLRPDALLARLAAARKRVRSAFDAVVTARTVRALAPADPALR